MGESDEPRPIALDHVEVLAAEGAAFIAAVREGPLDAEIPACPGWQLATLAGHVGQLWRWGSRVVNGRPSSPVQPGGAPMPEAADADQWFEWLEDGLVLLLDALRSCPADTPMWGFGLHPRTEAFWRRRQALETAIHRVDAEQAIGEAAPIAADVAADGVSEFLEVMLPRLYRGQQPPGGQWKLAATDTNGSWAVGDPAGGVGMLEGKAADLFLAVWRRGSDGLKAGGDLAVVEGWRRLGAP